MSFTRRQFLLGASTTVLTGQLYSTLAAEAEFKLGYHAITWREQLEQAMNEISELGYRGIQIHQPDYAKYAQSAGEFKTLLAAKHLTLVSLSTRDITIKPETEKQEIADCVTMARWMKEVGGLYLQVSDAVRGSGYRPMPDDYRKLGRRLTELGKRTFGEYGIKLGYHNQMNSLGERREEVDRILDATDAKAVWVLPDIAHLHVAQGDEVKFTRDYITRIVYPHFKDVRISQPWSKTLDGSTLRPKYDFVELGQGKVNVQGVFQLLKDFRYQGWIVIELDSAPAGRTPKESAAISKRFVEERLKLKV
jgi:inosose dehydratase